MHTIYSILLLTSGGLVGGTITLYLLARRWHRTLRDQVYHCSLKKAIASKAYSTNGLLDTTPLSLSSQKTNEDYRIIYDISSTPSRPGVAFPANEDELERVFTKSLRRNTGWFARFPQSWMIWLIARTPEQRDSFSRDHIEGLEFRLGELVCGVYRVAKRMAGRVEIAMELPSRAGAPARVGGMLIISLESSDAGKGTVMRTETWQWTKAGSGVVLPLERGVVRWMHEAGSWWLLVTEVEFLGEISGKS